MRVNVPLPFDQIDPPGEFTTLEAVAEVGAAVERAGFHAGHVTDHPCPTVRWLDSGGHYAQGPFVMLAMLAAKTTRLRLMTSVLVLPYRNPFVVARDVATLDCFSGGRLMLSVGVGYMKGEFRAMGVDFERRNELMDEYLRALRAALTGEEFSFEGHGYVAFGNRILPGPVQKPLPIYCGGNAKKVIRRVVDSCEGWNPFFTFHTGANANTTRTTVLAGADDLRAGMEYMRQYCEQVGRRVLPEVVLGGVNAPEEILSSQETLDRLCTLRELGVGAAGVRVEGRSRAEWCDNAERVGEEVIAKLDR